jgi:hypothetical protein
MPRTQIEPHKGDKRYIRRKRGKFTSPRTTWVARWPLTDASVRSELLKAAKVIAATSGRKAIYLVRLTRGDNTEPL